MTCPHRKRHNVRALPKGAFDLIREVKEGFSGTGMSRCYLCIGGMYENSRHTNSRCKGPGAERMYADGKKVNVASVERSKIIVQVDTGEDCRAQKRLKGSPNPHPQLAMSVKKSHKTCE